LNDLPDQQLLGDYAVNGSDAAFAELVRRHIDLVYSAALRMLRNAHEAQDVTQKVFIVLAREAGPLANRAALSGWLYSTTSHLAAKYIRTEMRRRAREEASVTMTEMQSAEDGISWDAISPQFDDALGELSEVEREALLLRYFERKSVRELAIALRVSEGAAQKRVNRAVERLRAFFAKRGVAVGASGLVAIISANAVQAAPSGLAATVTSAAAIAGAAVHSSSLITTTKAIAMTTMQKSLIAATLIAAAGTGIYEARQASSLREQLQLVQQQRDSLNEQVEKLQADRADAEAQVAGLKNQIARTAAAPAELMRLRGEVGRLRGDSEAWSRWKAAQANDATAAVAKSWLNRLEQLKQRAERMADKRIPELDLLTDKEWLDTVKDAKQLETDTDYRQALHRARESAKQVFGELARSALTKYAEANGGMLPADWSQLQPYFERPVDESVFRRYSLLQTGRLSDVHGGFLFAETAAPVDDDYDSYFEFGMNGTRSSSSNPANGAVEDAAEAFAQAHNGLLPSTPAQLTPYLKRAVDSAAVQRILDRIPPGVTTLDQLKSGGTVAK